MTLRTRIALIWNKPMPARTPKPRTWGPFVLVLAIRIGATALQVLTEREKSRQIQQARIKSRAARASATDARKSGLDAKVTAQDAATKADRAYTAATDACLSVGTLRAELIRSGVISAP